MSRRARALDHGGPHRVVAMVYRRGPGWPTGPGAPDEGLIEAGRAVKIAPEYPPNQLCLAEALNETEDPKQALLAAEEAQPLGRIRQAIVDRPDRWRRATRGKRFRQYFALTGESLKRPPRGFPADHPLVEDLRRKDYIAISRLSEKDVLKDNFLEIVGESFAAGRPLMRFLCEALEVAF